MPTTYWRKSYVPRLIARAGGLDVTVAGVTAKCLVDRIDVPVAEGQATSGTGQRIEVQCETGIFPALADGVTVTVEGVDYVAKEPRRGDVDGGMTSFECAIKG